MGSSAKMMSGLALSASRRNALLLAARQLRRAMLEAVGEPDRGDDLGEPAFVDVLTAEQQRERDVLTGGERGDQVERLEDEADALAAQLGELPVAEPGELRVAYEHRTGGERVEPGRQCIRVLLPEPDGP